MTLPYYIIFACWYQSMSHREKYHLAFWQLVSKSKLCIIASDKWYMFTKMLFIICSDNANWFSISAQKDKREGILNTAKLKNWLITLLVAVANQTLFLLFHPQIGLGFIVIFNLNIFVFVLYCLLLFVFLFLLLY